MFTEHMSVSIVVDMTQFVL